MSQEQAESRVSRAEIFYNKSNRLTGTDLKVSNTVAGLFILGIIPVLGCMGLLHKCEYRIEAKEHRQENAIGYKTLAVASVCGALIGSIWSVVTAPVWALPILYVYAAYPE